MTSRELSAATKVAAVIGDPVHHSLSPALHNSAFAALGLDWVYVAFLVTPGQSEAAIAAMRVLDLAGLSVTMPHKAAVVGSLDRLGPTAAHLGVVNTISWAAAPEGPELVGDSTDGPGFIDALRGDDGFDPNSRRCLILGAGGAARAVSLAIAEAGAARVRVVARRAEAAAACATFAGAAGAAVGPEGLAEAVEDSDLIVNATPVGMAAGDGLPFEMDPNLLRRDQFVADLIYAPATTPLIAAGRARGASTANGLGPLIHQAARQVAIWTGQPAPIDVMSAAALSALGHGAR